MALPLSLQGFAPWNSHIRYICRSTCIVRDKLLTEAYIVWYVHGWKDFKRQNEKTPGQTFPWQVNASLLHPVYIASRSRIPCRLKERKAELGLPEDAPALLLLDPSFACKGRGFKAFIKKHCPWLQYLYIPEECAPRVDPCRFGANHLFRKEFKEIVNDLAVNPDLKVKAYLRPDGSFSMPFCPRHKKDFSSLVHPVLLM